MKQYNKNYELIKGMSSRELFQMKINDLEEENKALFDKFKKMSKDFPNMTKKEQDKALRELLKLKENHTNNQDFKKNRNWWESGYYSSRSFR